MFVGNRATIVNGILQTDGVNIVNNVKILKTLGKGGFAVTYLVRNSQGELLAMKVIDIGKSAQQDINSIIKEIDALSELSSVPDCYPYIACYHSYDSGMLFGQEVIAIFSDYIEGPTLSQYLDKLVNNPTIFNRIIGYISSTRNSLPADELIKYMKQLLETLTYIHRLGYAHRDIKPDNIIYDTKNNQMVLIDFGIACSESCSGTPGTLGWAPPELMSLNPPQSLIASQSHDIWSLGLVFYVLANLKLPFDRTNIESKEDINRVINGYLEPSHHPDDKINNLINKMLNKNWRNRPTASALLKYINA